MKAFWFSSLIWLALASEQCLAAGAPKPAPAAAVEEGTTIVADHEAAVGLFLAPWQDDHASDLDWPPLHFSVQAEAVEPRRLQEEIRFDAQREASRRAHLQDRH